MGQFTEFQITNILPVSSNSVSKILTSIVNMYVYFQLYSSFPLHLLLCLLWHIELILCILCIPFYHDTIVLINIINI